MGGDMVIQYAKWMWQFTYFNWNYSDRTIYFQVFTNVPILVRGCNIIESAHSCHLLSEPWELHIHIRYFLKLKTVVYCLKPLDCKAEVGTNWTKTKCGFCWGFRPVCKWMADVYYICNHKMYHFVCIFIIFSWIVFWYNTIFHNLRDLCLIVQNECNQWARVRNDVRVSIILLAWEMTGLANLFSYQLPKFGVMSQLHNMDVVNSVTTLWPVLYKVVAVHIFSQSQIHSV